MSARLVIGILSTWLISCSDESALDHVGSDASLDVASDSIEAADAAVLDPLSRACLQGQPPSGGTPDNGCGCVVAGCIRTNFQPGFDCPSSAPIQVLCGVGQPNALPPTCIPMATHTSNACGFGQADYLCCAVPA